MLLNSSSRATLRMAFVIHKNFYLSEIKKTYNFNLHLKRFTLNIQPKMAVYKVKLTK